MSVLPCSFLIKQCPNHQFTLLLTGGGDMLSNYFVKQKTTWVFLIQSYFLFQNPFDFISSDKILKNSMDVFFFFFFDWQVVGLNTILTFLIQLSWLFSQHFRVGWSKFWSTYTTQFRLYFHCPAYYWWRLDSPSSVFLCLWFHWAFFHSYWPDSYHFPLNFIA